VEGGKRSEANFLVIGVLLAGKIGGWICGSLPYHDTASSGHKNPNGDHPLGGL
jgi:hypothetical protein